MFIKSEKHPSPPFTRNYLTHKTLNKKVKGEGLKTLFYIYARQGKKWKGTLGSKIGKTLKKEYNIRFKIYPSPFTSSPQHIHHRIPNICFPGLFFEDILLSFGDIFVFFGDILLSFGVIFGLMSSGIVIVWQTEEPTRYRPQEANLMSIRTKSSELSLFNPPPELFMK